VVCQLAFEWSTRPGTLPCFGCAVNATFASDVLHDALSFTSLVLSVNQGSRLRKPKAASPHRGTIHLLLELSPANRRRRIWTISDRSSNNSGKNFLSRVPLR